MTLPTPAKCITLTCTQKRQAASQCAGDDQRRTDHQHVPVSDRPDCLCKVRQERPVPAPDPHRSLRGDAWNGLVAPDNLTGRASCPSPKLEAGMCEAKTLGRRDQNIKYLLNAAQKHIKILQRSLTMDTNPRLSTLLIIAALCAWAIVTGVVLPILG